MRLPAHITRPLALGAAATLVLGTALLGTAVTAAARPATTAAGSSDGPSLVGTAVTAPKVAPEVALARSTPLPGSRADILARGRVVDVAAFNPQVTFFAGLPRRSEELTDRALKVSTPARLGYRDHITLAEAAKEYGARSGPFKKLQQTAAEAGVTVELDNSGLFARMTAPLARWQKLYGQKAIVSPPAKAQPYHAIVFTDDDGYLGAPKVFEGLVREWVAVFALYSAKADIQGYNAADVAEFGGLLESTGDPRKWPKNAGTLPQGTCDAPALADGKVYAPGQIRAAYGSDKLAERGWKGKDTRLAIVSLGDGFNEKDLWTSAKCFGYRQPKVGVRLGTGIGQQFVNYGPEAHLDIMTAAASIPDAESIRVIQVAGIAQGLTDGIARSLDRDDRGGVANDVVSISYGICEVEYKVDLGPFMSLNEDLLKMGTVIGTSFVVAAGDNGTSMCGPEASLEAQAPLVWYPASSPWVTSVGGTRLTLGADNERAGEVVWNDMPFVGGYASPPDPGPAGGGGPSAAFSRPWYQRGASLTGPRLVPDVSLLGAMRPGWPLVYDGTVYTVGGTSGGTPFLAANIALMAAYERGRDYPTLGLLNPWFYRLAANSAEPPFFDVVRGTNAVQPVGCCVAYRGYDMASGVGVPMLGLLARQIPPPPG